MMMPASHAATIGAPQRGRRATTRPARDSKVNTDVIYSGSMPDRTRTERIASVATLDDPTSRDVFDFVSAAVGAVTRDAAADALGVSRRIAAAHLDKLAEQGLLSVEFRRLGERTGPG